MPLPRTKQSLIRPLVRVLSTLVLAATLAIAAQAEPAAPYQGVVAFNGVPVPGATVTLTQNGKKFVTVTDTQGFYNFPDLAAGSAILEISMTGFAPLKQEITIPADALAHLDLKILTLDQIHAELKPVPSTPFTEAIARSEPKKTADAPKPTAEKAAAAAANAPAAEELQARASDGLLVNGSVNNAATSQFTLGPRFGNTASGKSLYNYSLYIRAETSALDAKSYSLTGADTTKPNTDQVTGGFNFGGPLKLGKLLRNGPNVFAGYQRTRNSVSITTPALFPDLAERAGNFLNEVNAGGHPIVVYNPATGLPYPGDTVPITAQAAALLALYPLPNIPGNAVYNYQAPLVTDTHQDSINSNASKTIGRKNQVSGSFAMQSTRVSSQNLLNFIDRTDIRGINTTANWSHTLNAHMRWNVGYQYSRQSTRETPFFQNRTNVSGNAGISGISSVPNISALPAGFSGNLQDPADWGPPTLSFTGGTSTLYDANASFLRNQTNGINAVFRWNRGPHNFTFGGDFRRQEYNYLTQANPRGTLQFTGAATSAAAVPTSGSDLADFLIGIPDASTIAFGNADKYLRQSVYDAYANDDWRVSPSLTVNGGIRWEYGAPITEVKNRLVNLDVAPGFTNIMAVQASSPHGPLTGQNLPSALMFSDRHAFEPRIGISWRPIPGSSLLVSSGYGVTYDTSVYQGIASDMTQQYPLSRSQSLQNSAACPLNFVNPFPICNTTTQETFGVDPNFKVGYLQTWNLKLQRDLPESLQMVVTYLGNKGTRGAQLFLPNTVPLGCLTGVPCGFEYLTSNGNSTRESGQFQLRRRLTSGFTASLLYTFSKSIDDDSSLGGSGAATASSATIAQNWLDLRAERGLSTFDQRHLLNAQVQYTTGMGKGGGTLLTGWKGKVYKEWTVQTQINAGSGLPENPLYAAELVAGYSSFIRPDRTAAPLHNASGFINPGAFAPPANGFGNARRNSITGPNQFSLNAALVRTFRLTPKYNLDSQIAATNALNHVTYTSFQNNINSNNFGLPAAANTMRQVTTSLRLRF